MPYETMILGREEGFAVLTLNRPPANAISDALIRELNAVLSEIESERIRQVPLITAPGQDFLRRRRPGLGLRRPRRGVLIRFGNSVLRRIERFPSR